MPKSVVLVVDDQEILRDEICENLEGEGYATIPVDSADSLIKKLPKLECNIILLDLMLQDANGLELISKIREYTDVPIIIISGRTEMVDRVIGLEMGADDYVSKPLPMKELSSRIKAQLRRYNAAEEKQRKAMKTTPERTQFGSWTLDGAQLQVFNAQGQSCCLTAKEFRLLEALVRAPNRVLSREQLLDRTRPDDFDITDRAVDVQILRIRRKIGDKTGPSQIIQTVRGIGYMLLGETKVQV